MCLPYFYVIGQPKCATHDLAKKLRTFPQIANYYFKGDHFFVRGRFNPGRKYHYNYYVIYSIKIQVILRNFLFINFSLQGKDQTHNQ